MTKYAHFDHTAPQPAPVLGYYDTDFAAYTLPASVDLIEVSDTQWAQRLTLPYVQGGMLVAAPAPSLSASQDQQIAVLRAACRQQILAGYQSSALGAAHTYPATATDQINMLGSVTASLLPGLPTGWATPFWCADAAGVWAMRDHWGAQIQQAGSDGKASVVTAQQKLAALTAQVQAATTGDAVAAVTW